jgi:predicted nucleotidyltransferase
VTVSDSTIEEWARLPGSLLLSWTEDVLRDALRRSRRLEGCEFEIFLQGSFANRTYTKQSSDVDLVVMMTLPLQENIEALGPVGRSNFNARYEQSEYDWQAFRKDVLAALRERYFVKEGSKCIDIHHWDSMLRVPADILPAIEYRKYHSFPLPGVEHYDAGVYFRDSRGRPIVNYPKQHQENGRYKDRSTRGRFTAVVRAVKAARKELAAREIDVPAAPSYFVECLLYNLPDEVFTAPLPSAVRRSVAVLLARAEDGRLRRFRCQNELVDLFGDGPDQWDVPAATAVVTALNALLVDNS